jgi:hypothetical protein
MPLSEALSPMGNTLSDWLPHLSRGQQRVNFGL